MFYQEMLEKCGYQSSGFIYWGWDPLSLLVSLFKSNDDKEEEEEVQIPPSGQQFHPLAAEVYFDGKKSPYFQEDDGAVSGKTAGGLCCILGGTLLCLIPTPITQGLGAGLITSGVGLIITDLDEQSKNQPVINKPYYDN